MHDIGEQQRPAANAINQIQDFFAPNTNDSLDNSLSNIIDGGGVLFDDVTSCFQQKKLSCNKKPGKYHVLLGFFNSVYGSVFCFFIYCLAL